MYNSQSELSLFGIVMGVNYYWKDKWLLQIKWMEVLCRPIQYICGQLRRKKGRPFYLFSQLITQLINVHVLSILIWITVDLSLLCKDMFVT